MLIFIYLRKGWTYDMSITIRDCLQLPSLSLGNVIAGSQGLDNIVTTVSVMEFEFKDSNFYTFNELLITAFYTLKDDVPAQCKAIESFKNSGNVGLVLFYSNIILKKISPLLIETANRIHFPIITLPGRNMGLRYSDVISDVMEAIFIDRKQNDYFINDTMKRISQLPKENQNIRNVLQIACDYTKASFFLCDNSFNLISEACWPISYTLDFNFIKLAFENNKNLKFCVIDSNINQTGYNFYKMTFKDKDKINLTLFAASKNSKLNATIMSQIIKTIELFSLIWNYNLNFSAIESLIPAILDNDRPLVDCILAYQKIDISTIDTLFLVNIETNDAESTIKEKIVDESKLIFRRNNKKAIIDVFGKLIVILSTYSNTSTRDAILWDEFLLKLNEIEQPYFYTIFTNLSTIEETRNAYLKYCNSINIARKIYPLKQFFCSDEIDFAYKCRDIINSLDNEKKRLMDLLSPIIDDNEDGLLQTLTTYFLDADSEVKKTAELLFVHRNTIQYRLSKIKVLLNRNISKMPAAYDIYLAAALTRTIG